MSGYLSIESIFCEVWGYPLSFLEAFGTLAGITAVWLAARSNILTWPVGIVNILASFFLFYQLGLYSGMFLQVYFLITGLYGWWYWHRQNDVPVQPVTVFSFQRRMAFLLIIALASVLLGWAMIRMQEDFSGWFPQEVAFPYFDAFATTASVLGNWFMARRKLENWVIWLAVDVIYVCLYATKGIYLYSIQYFVFCLIAAMGLRHWWKEYKMQIPDEGLSQQ